MPETTNALERGRAELARRAGEPPDLEQARRLAELWAAARLRRARAEQRAAHDDETGDEQ